MGVTISGGGGDPGKLLARLRRAAAVTVGDALYAGQRQRTRVLDRTARGVDADGQAFAPYSTNGPYYYNPHGRLASLPAKSKPTEKQTKSAVNRLYRKVGASGGAAISRTGRSIRFESYAAFKRWLGRSGVDLRGPAAPHMLQGIIVKVGGLSSAGRDTAVALTGNPEPAQEMRVGIYGDAAKRATGHNTGAGALPVRHFFGIGRGDARAAAADILARIRARLKG